MATLQTTAMRTIAGRPGHSAGRNAVAPGPVLDPAGRTHLRRDHADAAPIPRRRGRVVSEIVHRTREAHAERYLAAERNSLTDVSEMLGFAAPSAFSRWFRQRFGISPTEWRAGAGRTAAG